MAENGQPNLGKPGNFVRKEVRVRYLNKETEGRAIGAKGIWGRGKSKATKVWSNTRLQLLRTYYGQVLF